MSKDSDTVEMIIVTWCQVEKAPPVLLRVNSHQHSLQICENTWHYMKVPYVLLLEEIYGK
jgi:hypothetical protein